LSHVEIINELGRYGFIIEDLFVVLRNGKPGVSCILRQAHARKNNSYFLVFLKPKGKRRWMGLEPMDRLTVHDKPAPTAPIKEQEPVLDLFR
jgi:hypothetical protein